MTIALHQEAHRTFRWVLLINFLMLFGWVFLYLLDQAVPFWVYNPPFISEADSAFWAMIALATSVFACLGMFRRDALQICIVLFMCGAFFLWVAVLFSLGAHISTAWTTYGWAMAAVDLAACVGLMIELYDERRRRGQQQ